MLGGLGERRWRDRTGGPDADAARVAKIIVGSRNSLWARLAK
jgi:hypothetical protein